MTMKKLFNNKIVLAGAIAALLSLCLALPACTLIPGFPGASHAPTDAPGPSEAIPETTPEATAVPLRAEAVINEVVSSNIGCFTDEALGTCDWVELKNPSDEPADISGFKLSDGAAFENALTFPEGTVIAPNGLLTVLCAENASPRAGVYIAPFGLSRSGDALFLSDGVGAPAQLNIPPLEGDISFARREDGSYGFSPAPTFSAENTDIYASLEEALAAAGPLSGLAVNELVTGSEGWAELINVSDSAIELSRYRLTDDQSEPNKWAFPAMKLEPGALIVVELTGEAGESPLSASFKVSRTENALFVFDARGGLVDTFSVDTDMPRGLSAVRTESGVAYTALPTKGAENSTPFFYTVEWTDADPFSAAVILNEVCPENKYGITDSYGDRSDWVELLNQSDNPVDLSLYYLSDDPADPMKWQLPKVSLLPHKYAIVFLSGNECVGSEEAPSELHAPFSLSKNDGGIWLACLDGMTLDTIAIPEDLNPNVSIGRNGSNEIRYYAAPTPGEPNSTYGTQKSADAGGFNARSVYISEVSAVAPVKSGQDDWIELYNASGESKSLAGWSITDDPEEPRKYKLDKYTISAGGYAVIYCKSGAKSGKAPFSLSNGGETLYLINSQGGIADVFKTGATGVGVTSGRAHLSQTGERVFFTTATKGYKNSSPLSGTVAEPTFSKSTLYCSDPSFTLTISCKTSGAVIRYTTDGSIPTKDSKAYTGPIKISSSCVIRARAFKEGLVSSPTAAHTYVFGNEHTMPVVCISLSKSDYSKMYVGKWKENGAVEKGEQVPCFMEYYVSGRLAISSGAGVRVSGASTATYAQKSLGLYFKAGYGRSSLDYPLFDNCKVKSFRSITLRNSGQDAFKAHIRDSFVSKMCRWMDLDVAAFRPVIVYINGEYRGIYDMKENMNEDYLVGHKHADRDKVEIARRNGYMKAGTKALFKELLEMCRTLDFSDDANFKKLEALVDTDSMMDYLIARTYFYDYDMFNQKYWHTTDNKVRWRAILFDSDYALDGNSSTANNLSSYFNPAGVTSPHGYVTQMDIFCALNQNKGWREKFIVRYIYAVEYKFSADKAVAALDELVEIYRPEMKAQINKWHMPASYSGWEDEIAALRRCLKSRPENALKYIKRYYGISDSKFAEYEAQAKRMANGQ